MQQVFVNENDFFERKSPQMRNALSPLLGDGLFISDGETWKTRRKLIAPLVHASRLPIFAPVMVEAANELADRWAASPGPIRIDALTEMASLTSDIICRTVFGRRLAKAHAHEIVDGFSDYQQRVEQTDQRAVRGRHRQRMHLARPHPAECRRLERAGDAGPFSGDV